MLSTEAVASSTELQARPARTIRSRDGLSTAIAVAGLLLVVGIFVAGAFGRAAAGSRLVDQARPAVGPAGIVKLRDDTDLIIKVINASTRQAIPALASQLGLTPAEFNTRVARQFPNTAAVTQGGDQLAVALDKTVSNLEAHTGDFADADAIPLAGIDPRVIPYAAIGLGLVLVAVGLYGWKHPSRRQALALALIGAAMVVGPLASAIPHKAQGTERLLASLSASGEKAEQTRQQFDTARNAVAEIRTGILPAAAQALRTTPEQLLAGLVVTIPDLSELSRVDDALDTIEADVRFREQRRFDLARVKGLPYTLASWLFIAVGAALSIAGLARWGRLGRQR